MFVPSCLIVVSSPYFSAPSPLIAQSTLGWLLSPRPMNWFSLRSLITLLSKNPVDIFHSSFHLTSGCI